MTTLKPPLNIIVLQKEAVKMSLSDVSISDPPGTQIRSEFGYLQVIILPGEWYNGESQMTPSLPQKRYRVLLQKLV